MSEKDINPGSWWYQEGDETCGPVDETELQYLMSAGKLSPNTMVWREDFGNEWRTIEASGLRLTEIGRAIDVSDKWRETFAQIAASERSRKFDVWGNVRRPRYPYSIPGLLFGPLYYLYLRMWHRALAIVALISALGGFEEIIKVFLNMPFWLSKPMDYIPFFLCGACAKHDYYRFKIFGERIWTWKPVKPFGNSLVGGAVVIASFVAFLAIPVAASSDQDVLANISGVWGLPGLKVSIDLAGPGKRVVINGRPFDVAVKDADSSDGVVVLSPMDKPKAVVTLRQIWSDAQRKTFRIAITFEGRSATLGWMHGLDGSTSQATTDPNVRRGRIMIVPPPIRPAAVSDSEAGLSGVYCRQGMQILKMQTFSFRAQNLPVDTAMDSFASEDNFDYRMFMLATVRNLYKDPDGVRESLDNGTWMSKCISVVRGF